MPSQEIPIAIFDLNGTLYNKSSKDEFFKFICSKKLGKAKYIFQMGYYKMRMKLHTINQTEFKENFFNYLDNIPPKQVEAYANEYWEKEYPGQFNQEIIKRLDSLRKKGVKIYCATGGLEIYVKPLFKLYRVDGVVGTVVEYVDNTYLVKGEACKGEEKIKRLEKHCLNGQSYKIVEAYSDSKEVILDKAEKAFLVDKGEIKPYTQQKQETH
jgi:HAD superfamily phosphoserine phosphatase-like hydrolase